MIQGPCNVCGTQCRRQARWHSLAVLALAPNSRQQRCRIVAAQTKSLIPWRCSPARPPGTYLHSNLLVLLLHKVEQPPP